MNEQMDGNSQSLTTINQYVLMVIPMGLPRCRFIKHISMRNARVLSYG